MTDVVTLANEGDSNGGAYEALAQLNDGFLGTGYSSAVEASIIAMVFIGGYVAFTTARYFLSGTAIMNSIAGALGFLDR